MFFCASTGSVWIMVSTVSSMVSPFFIIVSAIVEVRVAKIFALTPLLSPSDKTATLISLST